MSFPGNGFTERCLVVRHKWNCQDLLLNTELEEEGMATHFNILAWKIPWTEGPGGLYILHGAAKELNTTFQNTV